MTEIINLIEKKIKQPLNGHEYLDFVGNICKYSLNCEKNTVLNNKFIFPIMKNFLNQINILDLIRSSIYDYQQVGFIVCFLKKFQPYFFDHININIVKQSILETIEDNYHQSLELTIEDKLNIYVIKKELGANVFPPTKHLNIINSWLWTDINFQKLNSYVFITSVHPTSIQEIDNEDINKLKMFLYKSEKISFLVENICNSKKISLLDIKLMNKISFDSLDASLLNYLLMKLEEQEVLNAIEY